MYSRYTSVFQSVLVMLYSIGQHVWKIQISKHGDLAIYERISEKKFLQVNFLKVINITFLEPFRHAWSG